MLTIADLRDFLSEEVITEEMNFSSSRRKYIASLCPDINIGLDLYKAVDITRRGANLGDNNQDTQDQTQVS